MDGQGETFRFRVELALAGNLGPATTSSYFVGGKVLSGEVRRDAIAEGEGDFGTVEAAFRGQVGFDPPEPDESYQMWEIREPSYPYKELEGVVLVGEEGRLWTDG